MFVETQYSNLYIHLLQATYDPSQGYSPQPVELTGMALSRELQVYIIYIHSV